MSALDSCCLPKDAPFHSYTDVIRHLDSLGLFHVDMGLGRMKDALAALKLDRLPFPSVQVVGTNGKGSTSTFISTLARAHGLRCGLYTSPHFIYPEERIRLDGKMLPRHAWPVLACRAVQAREGLTYFELLTVMAADAFVQSAADMAVFEAGLGGRYDGTTALPADMVVFAPIGMDHMQVLGSTLEAIADDKSHALREGVRFCVSAPQEPSVRQILLDRADSLGIPLCFTDGTGNGEGRQFLDQLPAQTRDLIGLGRTAPLGLRGPYQRTNAATALLAFIVLSQQKGWNLSGEAVSDGLEAAFIPGRLQHARATERHPELWLDGAHNAHGLTALEQAVAAIPQSLQPGALVFSCLADKGPDAFADKIARIAAGRPLFVPTIADNPRAADGTMLTGLISAAGGRAQASPSLAEAIDSAAAAGKKPVLIFGSLYLLSGVFERWPELLERS